MPRVNKIEIIINAEDKASKVLGGVSKALGGIGKIAAGAAVAVTGAAAGIGLALGKLAMDAAPLEGIGFAFDKMADRVGLSLDELREASAGTVSDFELMRKANIALTGAGDDLGREFGKNLPKLMEAARAAAKATGQDVDFLFESLVTGVKRGSPMLIDNTGLVVKLGEANEAMAAKVGKAVQDLTAEEKSIALLNATVEAGQRMVDEFGGGTLTAAEKMAKFRANIQNAKDQIGIAMLPALNALMEPLGNLAETLGPKLVEWAQALGKWLGENLPIAIETASNLISQLRNLFSFLFAEIKTGKIDLDVLYEILENFLPPEIVERIVNFASIAQEIFPIVRDTILGAMESIKSWFVTNWPIIKAVFLTVWEVIKAVALTIADIFQNQVLPPLQEAFANLTEAMAKLGIDWGDVWSAIGQAIKIVAYIIGAAILGIIGVLTALITTFANVLAHQTAILSDMADTFKLGLESIASMVGGAMTVIKGIFTGDLNLIKKGLKAWQKGIVGLFKAMGQGVINAIKLIFGTIITAVTTFISTFINFFVGLKETLVGHSIIRDMMDAMFDIISSVLSEILGRIAGFVSDMIGAFSDLAGRLYSIGANIMESLKSGIMSKVQSIVDAVRDVIKNIIEEAKDALDIFSPSGVFRELGRAINEGLALGIAGSAGLPASAAVSAAAGAVRTTNNYFNLTVHSQAETGIVVQSFETMRALVG